MAAWMLHGLCCGEEAGARNLVFFRVKWLQPTMKGTSSVRRVRLRSFLSRIVPPMCFATSGCVCVRSSMRFLNLWLQIALEWLHECCMGYVVGRKPAHETLCFSVWSGCRRRWKVPRLCDGCGCGRFCRELFLLCVLQRVVVSVCVVLCGSWSCGCRLHWNGCMNVAWAMLWGGSRSTKPCVFPCKVAAGDDERYLVCATGAAAVVSVANCSSYVFCNEWLCLCA